MKKTMRIKPIILALAATTSMLGSTPVFALTTVYDPAVFGAVKGVGVAITTGVTSIIAQLRQNMAANDSSSMKVADVINRSGNNVVQRTADLQKLEQTGQIERSLLPPIDPCANAGMGFANPAARTFRPGGSFGANIVNNRFTGVSGRFKTGSVRLNDALDISEGNKPAPSPEVQAMLAQQGGCEAYAFGNRAKSCQDAGMPAGAAKYPNADINASTVFDGAQTKDDLGKISWTLNEEQVTASKAYLRNLTNPIALRDLTATESKTDAGRQYLAMRDSYLSRLDMSQKAALEWTSESAPYKENVPVIEAMLEGAGAAAQFVVANIASYGPKGGNWRTDGISNHAMLQIEANRRANNPAWILELANASDPLTLQREQLAVSAQTNLLLTRLLLSQDKQRMLLGAIYQSTGDRDAMPNLITAHNKAVTSNR